MLIPHRKGDKWGYIDKKGRMVIPPVYDDVQPFSENVQAMVEVNGKHGYIDTKGDIVRPFV
jgi:DNA-binding transcriptional regulator/RsmH inhibitor MraZ